MAGIYCSAKVAWTFVSHVQTRSRTTFPYIRTVDRAKLQFFFWDAVISQQVLPAVIWTPNRTETAVDKTSFFGNCCSARNGGKDTVPTIETSLLQRSRAESCRDDLFLPLDAVIENQNVCGLELFCLFVWNSLPIPGLWERCVYVPYNIVPDCKRDRVASLSSFSGRLMLAKWLARSSCFVLSFRYQEHACLWLSWCGSSFSPLLTGFWVHPVRGSPSRRTLVQLTIFTVVAAQVGATFAQLYRCLRATSLQLHWVFEVVHGRVDL